MSPTGRQWKWFRWVGVGRVGRGRPDVVGDVAASWDALAAHPTASRGTTRYILRWHAAGAGLVACDIGGFNGGDRWEGYDDLLVRWYQLGVFMPIMRVHSKLGAVPHFPFLFAPAAAAAMRRALLLRYSFVPLLYALAHEQHRTGTPMIRPLAMAFPDDPAVTDLATEWLLGEEGRSA
eukprot:gene6140-20953_t